MTRRFYRESSSTTRLSTPAIGVILLLAFLVAIPPAAEGATTITVTTTADNASNDGFCSLREAVAAANTDAPSGGSPGECPAGSGTDTIVVPAGTYPIGAQLSVTSDLTISGAGAATTILDGGGSGGVLNISGGTVTVQGVTITNGNGSSGGGINNGGTLTVTNSTISGNTAVSGGGINNGGTLTVTNSTISGNTATGGGGGINNTGTLTVTNSTISGNNGSGGGGGIFNTGTLTVTNSTISGNTGAGTSTGVHNQGSGVATLTNTIAANNGCSATITDGGNNLSYPGTTCPGINADPLLGSLQNNGGPTATMALGAGSAAIDAVPVGNSSCPATDQRGVLRPQGPRCDIGAFERYTPTISTTPNPATATAGSATFLNDSATLTGGSSPGGNVLFSLFSPADATCTGTPAFTQTVALSSLTATTTNTTIAATTGGTWRWTAAYLGDTVNNSVASDCDEEEVVVSAPDSPDLQITKSCPAAGLGSFNCTLVVNNPSGTAATNVVVTDDLSPGLTAGPVSSSDSSFTCTDPPGDVDISCTAPSLAPGASVTFTYTVSIGETAVAGQSFTNNAVVSSSTHDGNQTQVTMQVPACTKTGSTLSGTQGNDVLCGTAGNDSISGLGGDDLIFLSGGTDQATGGDGNDTILGGPGSDKLTGGSGNDRLFGNDGNDTLTGGAGSDLGQGGAGTDTCTTTESGVC